MMTPQRWNLKRQMVSFWDDSYDDGYKSYTNNQMSTFDESYSYKYILNVF